MWLIWMVVNRPGVTRRGEFYQSHTIEDRVVVEVELSANEFKKTFSPNLWVLIPEDGYEPTTNVYLYEFCVKGILNLIVLIFRKGFDTDGR